MDDSVYRWVFKDYFLNFTLSQMGRGGGGAEEKIKEIYIILQKSHLCSSLTIFDIH